MTRVTTVLLLAAAFAVTALAGFGPPTDAPEVDPGSIGTALALVSTVILMTRRRAKR